MDEVADTVKQMAQFMMGKGPVTLSDSLRDAIVAGVKEEFEAKLREEREAHSKEMQSLKDQFALMLAAKDNEIAALKAKNGEDQIEFDQGKFILDFGGCPVGFQAKVSNIIIQKHK